MEQSREQLALSMTFRLAEGALVPADQDETAGVGAEALAGTVVDSKYRIIERLGRGGMGLVYSAHHLALGKDVALKTILSKNFSDDNWQRFQREARTIAK